MIDVFMILTGCVIIIIYHLYKKIRELKKENEVLKILFNMKLITKIDKDNPELMQITLEDSDEQDN